jgi:hypothetical protein
VVSYTFLSGKNPGNGQKRKENNDGNDEILQQPVLVLLLLCIGLPAA